MTERREIHTSVGPARLHVDRARRPIATLLVSHGAGGGVDAPDLRALADSLPRQGVTVLRLEQPWRVADRRVAGPPATLDTALLAVANAIRPRTPLIVGGRSAGARSACRSARAVGAAGVLAVSFPLHPPGRPERSRLPELTAVRVPTLVVQGERDPFGAPEEFPPATELVVVPAADHGLKVPRRGEVSQQDALAVVVEAALEWVVREISGPARTS